MSGVLVVLIVDCPSLFSVWYLLLDTVGTMSSLQISTNCLLVSSRPSAILRGNK